MHRGVQSSTFAKEHKHEMRVFHYLRTVLCALFRASSVLRLIVQCTKRHVNSFDSSCCLMAKKL
jgi:hypothetical protein